MVLNRSILAVLLASVALTMPARPAHACSCMQQDRETAFEQATSVFEGHVLAFGPATDGRRPVTFEVVRTWKSADAETVELSTAATDAECGYAFEQGRSYLVYTVTLADGREEVSLCSRTVPMEGADADIVAMGEGVTPVDPHGLGSTGPSQTTTGTTSTAGCASCAAGAGARRDPVGGLAAWTVFVAAVFARRRRRQLR